MPEFLVIGSTRLELQAAVIKGRLNFTLPGDPDVEISTLVDSYRNARSSGDPVRIRDAERKLRIEAEGYHVNQILSAHHHNRHIPHRVLMSYGDQEWAKVLIRRNSNQWE